MSDGSHCLGVDFESFIFIFSSFDVFTSLGCRFDPRSGSPFYSLLVLMTVLVQGVRLRSRLTNLFFLVLIYLGTILMNVYLVFSFLLSLLFEGTISGRARAP